MSADLLALIAERFRALGEPARLQILQSLRAGERTVTELARSTGLGQANLSKHLQSLYTCGFVDRRKEGLYVYYHLADQDVFRMCDLVCGRMEEVERKRRRALARA